VYDENRHTGIWRRRLDAGRGIHLAKKAFNSVGNACLANPGFESGRPTMFIRGNSATAKQAIDDILERFGRVHAFKLLT
jgi:hypothetical protein